MNVFRAVCFLIAAVPAIALPVPFDRIVVTPSSARLVPFEKVQFMAQATDENDTPLAEQPESFTWSVPWGGTIDSSGLFTAGPKGPMGPFLVSASATVDGKTQEGSAPVRILAPQCVAGSIFADQTPEGVSAGDARLELGTRFSTSCDGSITKVRIWTNEMEGGEHAVRIWNESTGTCISGPHSWSFVSGLSGWKDYPLPAPVGVIANTAYILAVSNSDDKYYSLEKQGFALPDVYGSIVTYAASGVFCTVLGAMPDSSRNNENYFRDIVFQPAIAETREDPTNRSPILKDGLTLRAETVVVTGTGAYRLTMTDMRGRIVYQRASQGPDALSLGRLKPGAYVAVLRTPGSRVVRTYVTHECGQ